MKAKKMKAAKDKIVEMKIALEKSINHTDTSRIIDVLTILQNELMDVAILKETKIGVLVNKIKTSVNEEIKSNTTIKNLSQSLITKWKAIANTTSTSSSITLSRSSSVSTSSRPNPSTPRSSVDFSHITKNIDLSNKRVIMITKLLEGCAYSSTIGSEDEERMKNKAIELELNIFKFSDSDSDSSKYVNKVKDIVFALKQRKSLRERYIDDTLTGYDMIYKSSEELATKEEIKEKEDIKKKALEKVDDNAHKKLQKKNFNESGGAASSMYVCIKCKSTNVDFYELQTRSADEPMTVFLTCEDCGAKWKR